MFDSSAILDNLNAAQHQAVVSESKYLRVLAGAGSGKTRVLVHRMAWLICEQGLSPHSLMAVTFTNKAAGEMRSRIEGIIGMGAHSMWVGTFHGLAHRLLRQYAEQAHLPSNFQIIDSDDQLRMVKRLIQELDMQEDELDPRRVQGFINRCKDEGKRHRHLGMAQNHETTCMMEIYKAYEAHCEKLGIVDFAELLLRVYELVQENKEVMDWFHRTFKHILVDEFQDTNTIQYKWLLSVAGPEASVTIVGDDDQSIYGWRGARIANIHSFNKDFQKAETIRLEQNYRSTQHILQAANALIQNNEERLGKELWTDSKSGDKITLYGGFNELDEARFIVEKIKQWLQEGGATGEIAILYRSNAQSRVLEQALRQNSLPYKIYGGLRFFDRAEIRDALAYLRLLVNLNDDTAFDRVINVPPRGIGERTMAMIRERANQLDTSLWLAAKELLPELTQGRITKGLSSFFELIEHLVETARTQSFGELTKEMLKVSGLVDYIKSQPGERTFAKLENIQELITATTQYSQEMMHDSQAESEAPADMTLPQFLSEVALDAGEREAESDIDSIKLMTLHSAKGLEFPLVFLSGLEEGLFPHHRCAHDQALLEEERRLCYVGITRAMKKLYITYAEKRTFAGSSGVSRPSRFIKEIPPELLEKMRMEGYSVPPSSMFSRPTRKPKMVSSPDLPYQIGQHVSHPRFGYGTVLAGEGSGDLARVQVNFDKVGPKWLVVSYAKLTPA